MPSKNSTAVFLSYLKEYLSPKNEKELQTKLLAFQGDALEAQPCSSAFLLLHQ